MTKATAMAASRRTKDRAEFIALKAKGVDVVRETDTGRIMVRHSSTTARDAC